MTGTRPTRSQLIQGAISIVVVVGIFWFVLPQLADFSEVWRTIRAMTGFEVGVLAVVAAINLLTYLPVNMAVLPGLRAGEAFVSNNASTAVANTLPAGGALGVGVNFAMYRSWGFDNASITLALLVSGILNTFVKLGMPVVALALLVILGEASTALVVAAVLGVIVLAVAVGLFAGMLSSDRLADRIGTWLGRVATRDSAMAPPAADCESGRSGGRVPTPDHRASDITWLVRRRRDGGQPRHAVPGPAGRAAPSRSVRRRGRLGAGPRRFRLRAAADRAAASPPAGWASSSSATSRRCPSASTRSPAPRSSPRCLSSVHSRSFRRS